MQRHADAFACDNAGAAGVDETTFEDIERAGSEAWLEAIRAVFQVRLEIDSSTSLAAVAATRPRIVGMSNGRSPPPGFGIITRRTGSGRIPSRRGLPSKPSVSVFAFT